MYKPFMIVKSCLFSSDIEWPAVAFQVTLLFNAYHNFRKPPDIFKLLKDKFGGAKE